MSLMLIQPDYRNGSSLYQVCNVKKGNIRQNNFTLCFDRNKAAIEQNAKKEMKKISRINYLVRGVLLLIYMITIIVLDIGCGIRYFFRVVKDSVYKQRRYSPDSHLKKIESIKLSMVPISGKTPVDEYFERIDTTPFGDDVYDIYEAKKERLQEQNYQNELRFRS